MSHATTDTAPHTAPAACPNCGEDLRGLPQARHCPGCGQETHLHPPTLWEFVHEFLTHYVAFEGTLWRTLRGLCMPGLLTVEYLAGRRRLYLLPLRLYLSCSFVFFLAFKLLTGGVSTTVEPAVLQSPQAASSVSAPIGGSGSTVVVPGRPTASGAAGTSGEAHEDVVRQAEHAGSLLNGWAPYVLILMQPVFAALMTLLYLDRRIAYGEHFVFSLHIHSAWFLVLMAGLALPEPLDWMLLPVLPVYTVLAVRRVHGALRWTRALGLLLVLAAYAVALLGVTVWLAWRAVGLL